MESFYFIFFWISLILKVFSSYRPHHVHRVALQPQHFPLPAPPGRHGGLPHLLLLLQLQPKIQQIQNLNQKNLKIELQWALGRNIVLFFN